MEICSVVWIVEGWPGRIRRISWRRWAWTCSRTFQAERVISRDRQTATDTRLYGMARRPCPAAFCLRQILVSSRSPLLIRSDKMFCAVFFCVAALACSTTVRVCPLWFVASRLTGFLCKRPSASLLRMTAWWFKSGTGFCKRTRRKWNGSST